MTELDVIAYDADKHYLTCKGEWDLLHLTQLKQILKQLPFQKTGELTVDGQAITKIDSAGAWLLIDWQNQQPATLTIHFKHFSKDHQDLLAIVTKEYVAEKGAPQARHVSLFERVGRNTVKRLQEFNAYLYFIGHLTYEALRILRKPFHGRITPIASAIESTGVHALPIIGLLSFMIGVVIAYQMGVQLRDYGANIYIVNFLGLSILREFGPLLTAIMVAGRTGSAFTAQLGIMKINEEIDALNTMGVTPAELLIIPRIIALFIVLPLLTIWADFFGMFGGMMMANSMLNVSPDDFIQRFPQVIPLKTLILGLGKAPVFALIIASIGCFEGMRVKGSSESVGVNTTKSVVLSIFFIIVADAIFSIIFSELDL